MASRLAWLLVLSGCYEWDALEPAPTLSIAPACVAPGETVAVSWTGRDCTARNFERDLSEVEGSFSVPIAERTTFAIDCRNGGLERTAYVDDPCATAAGRPLYYVDAVLDASLSEWSTQIRLEQAPPGFPVDEPDLRVLVYVGWNEDGLVFGADVVDDSVETTALQQRALFRNDGIEILVDGGGDGSMCTPTCPLADELGEWQLFFDADGRTGGYQRDLEPSDGVILVSARQTGSYILEGLVPWALLAVDGAAPLRAIRLNFAANDRDDDFRDEDDPPALMWMYSERAHRDPNVWPTWVLRCQAPPSSCM